MIRFCFISTTDEQCMAHLKVLYVRLHVLVCLGRIYADHLHEAVSVGEALYRGIEEAPVVSRQGSALG